jgi:hypothetical protein
MAFSQVPFEYDKDTIQALGKSLTNQRLKKYLAAADNKFERAMDLYLWNSRLCKAIQFPIQVAEVTLRNAISEHLADLSGTRTWPLLDDFILRWNPGGLASVTKAKERLVKEKKGNFTADDVIAKLPLEFWIAALDGSHEDTWQTSVRLYFPNLGPHESRRTIHNFAVNINWLRNRVAHHEPIFSIKDLRDRHASILALVTRRCEKTSNWTEIHSTFMAVLHDRPLPDRTATGKRILETSHKPGNILPSTMQVSNALAHFARKRRDFVLVRDQNNELHCLLSDDLMRWTTASLEVGLVDFETPTLDDILLHKKKSPQVNAHIFVSETTTTSQAIALFMPKEGVGVFRPTTMIITKTGNPTENPLGLIFKPDFKLSVI